MKLKSILAVIAACLAVGGTSGCNSSTTHPPTVADVVAQQERAKETTQKVVDGIRNNPSLTDDQKAQMIARVGRGQVAKPQ